MDRWTPDPIPSPPPIPPLVFPVVVPMFEPEEEREETSLVVEWVYDRNRVAADAEGPEGVVGVPADNKDAALRVAGAPLRI